MLDADSELWVTISRCGSQLRLAVRDTNRTSSMLEGRDPPRATHRGLMLVAAVSESWGVLPTSDGGKMVWAVLSANPSSTRSRPPAAGSVGAAARSRRTPRPRQGRYPRPP